MAEGIDLSIFSMNVRGLGNRVKRRDMFQWLKEHKYDISCLQDVHITQTMESNVRSEWGGACVFSCFNSCSRGVAVLFKDALDITVHNQNIDTEGNYIILDLTVKDRRFTLCTVYGPNTDYPDFYVKVFDVITEMENASMVLCGDWNIVMNYDIDTKCYKGENNKRARNMLIEKMNCYELNDVWRIQHENESKFTWYKSVNSLQMARLDYFLISNDIMSLVTKSDIVPGYRTDHSGITLGLHLDDNVRGHGFWKFNSSLLYHKQYIDLVKSVIKDTALQYAKPGQDLESEDIEFEISDQLFFEMLKLEIRGKTIKFSSERKKELKKKEVEIEREIETLKQRVDVSDSVSPLKLLAEKQQELEELRLPQVKGAMLRSKAKYYEAGEKPTKFFCNIEKRNYIAKTMKRVVVDNTEICNQIEILEQQKLYYQNLYSSKIEDEDSTKAACDFFLKKENIKPLTSAQSKQCEGLIQTSEVKQVLKGMANNKSPGSDGFTAEFFKFFFPDLGHFLVRSLNYAFKSGELSVTQKQGVITCLPKGNKPRELLKNWRPISLLNVDYKILSGVMAKRMKEVLGSIISETQKGFLRNRFISENTRLVYDILDYLKRTNKNGVLLLIDFEKAFDSLEWYFINKVLEVYNFGSEFRKWFKVMYNNVKSTVINNGHFSEFFNISRGCRQGDPLSPYIFILCVEPLAAVIKNDNGITGLRIGNHCHKIGMYADDTFLLQDGSESSMNRTFEVLEMFHTCSGLKANIEKTQAVWLGPKCEKWQRLLNRIRLKWVEQFTLLGIHFDVDVDKMLDSNYEKRILDIENVLNLYRHRMLSLIGKITVIKTLAIPKIIHVIQTLPSPPLSMVNRIKTSIRKFLWNGKRAKISLEQLGNTIENGGLALTNIDLLCKSIKISWVRRLTCTVGGWQSLFEDIICKEKMLLWQLDKRSLNVMCDKTVNRFWKEVIKGWREFMCQYEETERNVLSYPIWNSYFLINRNIVAMKNKLIEKGLIYICDLLNAKGNFYSLQDFNEKYDVKLNFLDYMGIIDCIPAEWRGKNLVEEERLNIGVCKSLVYIQENYKCCKAVYSFLNKSPTNNTLKNRKKWNDSFGENIDETEWEKIMLVPWECTVESKLRSFQYHIINRSLVTNKSLYQWNLTESELCQFCNSNIETIEHMLFECIHVKQLWSEIFKKLDQYLTFEQLVNNHKAIICGVNCTVNYKIMNHVLLIVKKYIYNSRCLNRPLNVNGAIKMISQCYEIEYQLACQKASPILLGKFMDKWKPFLYNNDFQLR